MRISKSVVTITQNKHLQAKPRFGRLIQCACLTQNGPNLTKLEYGYS